MEDIEDGAVWCCGVRSVGAMAGWVLDTWIRRGRVQGMQRRFISRYGNG